MALLVSLAAVTASGSSRADPEPKERSHEASSGDDCCPTSHPGLVYSGAVFGAASLANFAIVGAYSGQQPDALLYLALTSGAAHYLLGVSLLTAGLIMDESDRQDSHTKPIIALSPTAMALQLSF
jgi:hypothetical protein